MLVVLLLYYTDEFIALFSGDTKVKCLSDAGLFLDVADVAGGRTLRKFFSGVVTYLGVAKNLPTSFTDHLGSTSCFFPHNVIANINTPMFYWDRFSFKSKQYSQEDIDKSAPRARKIECGYYVMRYMIEIITRSDLKRTVNEHFNDMMPYSQEDIDEVRGLWVDYFLNNKSYMMHRITLCGQGLSWIMVLGTFGHWIMILCVTFGYWILDNDFMYLLDFGCWIL